MILTVSERMGLLQILPQKGDFLTVKRLEEARNSITLTEEETRRFGVVVDKERISWKENGTTTMTIGEVASDQIVTVLRKMNDDKELESRYITLYEKFVEKKEVASDPELSDN